MNWTNRKAILYYRVSTDEQADRGYSLIDQEDRLQKFCSMMQIESVATFQDDYSAKSFDRPGWKKMLEHIKRHKNNASLLLFTNWSRFSRSENMGETYMMIDQLYKLGIEPQAIEQQLDLSVPENRLVLAFYIASPMVENLRRANNTKLGIRRSMKLGRWCNNAPSGYINGRDENDKPLLVIDPVKASIIRDIFFNYHSGMAPVHIMYLARKRGLSIRGNGTFSRIITNPLYAGYVRIEAWKDEKEETIKGIHEAIVDPDLFNTCKQKWIEETTPKPRVFDDRMPLRGVLYCNNCGAVLTGGRSKGKSGNYWWYYRCLHCNGENYSMEKAHGELLQILEAISLKEKYINYMLVSFDKKMKESLISNKEEVQVLRREIAGLENKLESTELKYLSDKLSFEVYEKYRTSFKAMISEKTLQLNKIDQDGNEVIELFYQAIPKMRNLAYLYEKCNLESKQKFINLIFINGLYKTRPGYRTPKLNPLFDLKAATDAGLKVGSKDKNSGLKPEKVKSRLFENQIEPLLRFVISLAA